MKKFLLLIVVLCLFSTVFAETSEISVNIDSVPVKFENSIYLKNNRVLVPMREIFEYLGAQVLWDDASETALGIWNPNAKLEKVDDDNFEEIYRNTGFDMIGITIGKTTAKINDGIYFLDEPAQIIHGRTYIPLRFIAESMECTVTWDNERQCCSYYVDKAALKNKA